jgi:DNA-binding transcriptional ArsR family regulator
MILSYQIKVEDSIVYELLLSFLLYKRRANLKYLNKGTDWIGQVNERLTAEFQKELEEFEDLAFGDVFCLLIENSPDKSQVDLFLKGLEALSATDMYGKLAPYLREKDSHILLELEKQRDQFVRFLTKWNDQYFQYVDDHDEYRKAIEGIRSELNNKMPPEAIVEKFATGLQIEMNDIQTVHMIPSIYFSPLHTFSIFKERMFVWYPIKAEQSDFDHILNVAKCLSDRNRLHMLQFLSAGKYTFTEVLKQIGGAKGNIHHHLMTLRSAGLVRIHLAGEGQMFYVSTRKAFINEFKESLHVVMQ